MKFTINNLLDSMRDDSEKRLTTFFRNKKVKISFSEVFQYVNTAVNVLDAQGITSSSVIAILGKNNLEWIIADLACIHIGAKLIPIELDTDISILTEAGLALDLILLDEAYASEMEKWKEKKFNTILLNELQQELPSSKENEQYMFSPREIFSYKMTSGSTGRPKIIGHNTEALENSINGVQEMFEHSSKDKILVFLPVNLLQQRYWIYSAIYYKIHIAVVPKEYVLFALQMEAPTVLMGVPYIYELLYTEFVKSFQSDADKQHQFDMHMTEINQGVFQPFLNYLGGNIRYLWTGSAPMRKDILEGYTKMGVPLLQGYGMNETCIISKNTPKNNRVGSVGKLFKGISIKFDETQQILIKNQAPVCRKYTLASADDQENTFLEDGFIATGDIGYLDDEGYLYITGRKKEMIVLSDSKKVFPRVIEERIEAESNQIKNCIVYGDDRPYLVALVKANSPEVDHAEIKAVIDRFNTKAKKEEKIFNFCLIEESFTEENGFLSNQNKIRRNKIVSHFSQEIEHLYK